MFLLIMVKQKVFFFFFLPALFLLGFFHMAQSDSWTVMRYELTPNLNDIHTSRHIIVPESCIHHSSDS